MSAKVGTSVTNYLFGYGSLICSSSAAITGNITGEAQACIVSGITRSWSAKVNWEAPTGCQNTTLSGATAVTCSMVEGLNGSIETCGVLLKVEGDEMTKFDIREKGYQRIEIQRDQIKSLDSSLPLEIGGGGRIWCYISEDRLPSTATNPILQSYVDVIIKGCYEHSPKFVETFVKTTTLWGDGVWIDDRHNPAYTRADNEWSSEKAKEIDEILQRIIPVAFATRTKMK